jgi:hypothetical protein
MFGPKTRIAQAESRVDPPICSGYAPVNEGGCQSTIAERCEFWESVRDVLSMRKYNE